MKPSTQRMIEAAQQALRELVVPHVTDQWAASALRSVDVILGHLQQRVPVEGPMLYEDNADLARLLGDALAMPGFDLAKEGQLGADIGRFVADAQALSGVGYPTVDTLCDLNIRGRELADRLLHVCHRRADAGAAGEVHRALRAYLERHIARERAFFFPVFVGRPV